MFMASKINKDIVKCGTIPEEIEVSKKLKLVC